jgi:hypothetical protein
MKLTRLAVAELRQFRTRLELAALQPGLNLFAGANEAGKSTLVRAIRAAFFERYRSSAVEDLRPWGDSAATPTIEIDFSIAGTDYRLRKAFLKNKRCELQIGARRLEGNEAEEHLAALLGFQFAAKGASRPEHGGIPGLLWIEQGAAQELHDAVRHAAGHLQRALDAQLGSIAASGGDALLARVREQRGELRTHTGRPRGALEDAQAAADEADARVQALAAAAQAYREQVDALRLLGEQHATEERTRPWEPLRAQLGAADQALAQAQALSAQRSTQAAALARGEELGALLRTQLAADARQEDALAQRKAALQLAQAALEAARGAQAVAARGLAEAQARATAAHASLALARQEATRAQLQRQLESTRAHAAAVAELLQRALAEAEREAALRRQARTLALPPDDLQQLRTQDERLRDLGLQLQGLATRLVHELQPGAAVLLDGRALPREGEQLLAAPAQLEVEGVGRFTIAPGGSDLAARRAEQERLQAEQRALLQRLGLASRSEAEARAQAERAQLTHADAAAKALLLLAPRGLAALQAEAERTGAEHAQAQATLAQLPPAPQATARTPFTPVAPVEVALAAAEDAQRVAEVASQALDRSRQAQAGAHAAVEAAAREHDALASLRADAGQRAQRAQAQRRLVDTQAELEVKQRELQALDARIAAARPDILAQDVQRLRRSTEEAERVHRERKLQLVQLEAGLVAAGAQGVDETLAQAQQQQAAAARRRDELQRRADALVLLEQTLQAHRQALTQRLRAPLQRHLDHYLELLFPGGRLAVDEQLQPGELSRPQTGQARDAAAAGSLPFTELSFGAREQLGIISRLAYADLLREGGRPTLIILDDALVHSDAERLGRMKRVLYDAATRHQVLLFTCHAERWRDMGVAVRELRAA